MAQQPESLCRAVDVPEDFNLALDEVKAFPGANVSSLTYFVCGEGWKNRCTIEVVDIVTAESRPPPLLKLGGSVVMR
jgi:hypothetical protein